MMKNALLTSLCLVMTIFGALGQVITQDGAGTLRVRGIAIMRQLPDLISASISIKVEATEYNGCHEKVMATLQKAREIFMQQGIGKDLIKTNEIRVSENKVYKNGEELKIGFTGTVSIIIESVYSVEFTKKLLSGLKSDSMAFNYNIIFKLSEVQKNLLRKKAISMAIEDAKEKADLIAASSKVRLVRISSIAYKDDNYSSAGNDSDVVREYAMSSNEPFYIRGIGSNIPTIDFNPREIKIVKAVEIEWLIRDEGK